MKENEITEQSSVKNRLLQFLRHKNLSQGEFERICKLSNGYVNNIRKSIKSEKYDSNIAPNFPELNKFWLLFDKGEMLNHFENNKLQPRISYETEKGRPFYNADWTLSFKEVNDDTVFHPEFNIDFPPANKEGVNWFRAKGNSMIEINSGDYVALEKIEDFSWFPLGRIYGIITSNGFRTIKKIVQSDIKENYLLKASNPNKEDHPDQDIPKEMITGLYKIIYVIKDLDE